jgi:transcriptional regulator of acetoin/glycerol metabolism
VVRRSSTGNFDEDVLDDVFSRLRALCVNDQATISAAQLKKIELDARHTWQGEKVYIRHTPAELFKPVPISAAEVEERGAKAVASELGISRSWLYRSMKAQQSKS